MLPELGHFALILALLLAGLQAFFGIAGPMLGRDRWIAAVTPAVAGQFVMIATAVGCLVASFVANDFSVLYIAENSNSALPMFYRVTAMWGAHEGSLLLWILLLAAWTVAVTIGAARLPPRFAARVLGVLGIISFGFLLFTLATSNPFLRLDPAAPGGHDPESDPAGSGVGDPPADSLYRLCGLCRGVRVRVRGDARRPAGPDLGPLDAAVDHHRVGLPHLRHRAGKLLGVLRARLGRLLVLGSGRERFVHAVADGYRAGALARGYGQARPVQELDAAAGDPGVFHEHARHLPGALRGARVGALVRSGSEPRHFHSGLSHHHDRRSPESLCLARAAAEVDGRVRARVARIVSPLQQRAAGHCRNHSVRRHAGAADLGCAEAGHGVGRAAILQSDLHAVDVAAARPVVGRHPLELEARAPEGQAAYAAVRVHRRRGARLRARVRHLLSRPRADAGGRNARAVDRAGLARGPGQ